MCCVIVGDVIARSIYLSTSPILKSCNEQLSKILKSQLVDFPPEMPERDAAELRWVGLKTVNDLDHFIEANRDVIVGLAVHRLTEHGDEEDSLLRGISLLYACYVILARRNNLEDFMKFFTEHGFGPDERTLREAAKINIAFVEQFDKQRKL